MAKPPADKKPAPPTKKPAKPAARKKAAGSVTPARKATLAKKAQASRTNPKPAPKAAPTPAAAPTTALALAPADTVLTGKQQRFVDEYLIDLNATQAAIRAGYSAHTANEQGSQLLAKLSIQNAVKLARIAQQERTGITADKVLTHIANVALADARELVAVKTGCCRHCYGEGNRYQRTVGEMNRDREQWIEKGKEPAEFDEMGGIGFNPLRLPKEDCPECGGDGQARVVISDTRNLSERAVALYAGAKQTKYGIEVLTHSQMDALEKLAKHVGLYERDNQQKSDPLAAILNRIASGTSNGWMPVQEDPERITSAPRPGLPMNPSTPDDDEE